MKLVKSILVSLLLLSCISSSKAQVFTGGNIGMSFGNGGSYLEVAPSVGYAIKKLSVGVSPVAYWRMSSKSDFSYGGRVFAQYSFIEGVFAHLEFESLNTKVYSYNDTDPITRQWTFGLPIGLGTNYKINERMVAQGSVLYNVLHQEHSAQDNPIYRAGIKYLFN